MRTTMYQIIHPNGVSEVRSLESILAQTARTILYFYPADNTPGCTLEAQSFTKLREEFSALWVQVIGEKKNYGKTYVGTIRSTFLLNNTGGIIKVWRNVKVNGHAEKVLREVKG